MINIFHNYIFSSSLNHWNSEEHYSDYWISMFTFNPHIIINYDFNDKASEINYRLTTDSNILIYFEDYLKDKLKFDLNCKDETEFKKIILLYNKYKKLKVFS